MAPIFAADVGITPQIIDDVRLLDLRRDLTNIEIRVPLGKTYLNPDEVEVPLDIDRLVALIEPWQQWGFEEQVDLQEWIHPLNRIDACLSYFIQKYPSLLLIGPVKRTKSRGNISSADQFVSMPANSWEEINSVPKHVKKCLTIILRFLCGLMDNSSNKSIFNSVEELVDLLAAADDNIASIALEVLCGLSNPPPLHKQQAPEIQQHTTALHSSRTMSHKRLIAMARGWGTRGSGLGLFTCSTADDSEFGQGSLPQEAGELHFSFFRRRQPSEEKKIEPEDVDESLLVELSLQKKDIVDESAMATESLKGNDDSDESSVSKQKRRRVAPVSLGEQSIRSTPDLFFECLEKVGGRDQIPEDRIFALLSDIRLARSFHCRATRIAALELRLRAIITILNAHPSQDIMSGYFQAQPELCVELIDLLRPTVSSASVSAASSKSFAHGATSMRQDAISALANSPIVPYQLRELALQTLTALVGRRDGNTGALTGVARHSNVLNELGVGKGQYLGLLPTLIRFSLASFTTIVSSDSRTSAGLEQSENDALAFEIGLAFVQATMPPPIPRNEQLIRALKFIDSVLTLTSAVVSTQSGTSASALTECGLIPSLLGTVSVDHEEIFEKSGLDSISLEDSIKIKALLRFVTAQAIQIIEGAIVTQTSALTAFHDLNGVEIITKRLSKEILGKLDNSAMSSGNDDMDLDETASNAQRDEARLRCSQRVLLFSIVNCLTVVFHQESSSSSISTPSGSAQLRKDELTAALITILNRVDKYGGHLVTLIATLLTDVMNSDPHVVRHVHESGLAKAFLAFFAAKEDDEPLIPPVSELIVALPNVLSALALTEDGAKAIKDADPFPALLKIFYHPKYAMPRSRCLLNENTPYVGTGLEEIVRHVSVLKPLVCTAIANAMNKVADIGEKLAAKERQLDLGSFRKIGPASELENERSCLMQYALNFGQLLEQILHNEDHCNTFVSAGGLDALLRLQPCLMPTGREFLSHVCCLSCPSVSTISHSATEDAMTIAFRCISLRYDSFELVKIIMNSVSFHLGKLETLQLAMRQAFPTLRNANSDDIDATLVLDGLPPVAVFELLTDPSSPPGLRTTIGDYLRQVTTVQWVTCLLSSAIKAACQRSQEMGSGWSRQEREWKKELSSNAFEELMVRLCKFHRSAIFEACRIRTEDGFEEREEDRRKPTEFNRLRYRLRIVCPEGAVVRDGIEIDSCASVGNMEMGEISEAFDRCVNSSGVMRYRTSRGWVSEQTRGNGREPIAEVLSVWEADDNTTEILRNTTTAVGRIEAGVPDIQATSASILARLQTSYSELFSALAKVVLQSVRGIPIRNLTFEQGTIGAHVATVMRIMKSGIEEGLNINELRTSVKDGGTIPTINLSGISMYLGCMLSHLRASLFEEKRDRRTVNVPLLIVLFNMHENNRCADVHNRVSIFDAIFFIFDRAFHDFKGLARGVTELHGNKFLPKRRQSRTTAASLPAALSILQRLLSGSLITSSPVSSVLSRVKASDLAVLLSEKEFSDVSMGSPADEETFSPERFFRTLLVTVSGLIRNVWKDNRLVFAPPYVLHPIALLVSDVINSLEESLKTTNSNPSRNPRDESGLWNAFRGLVANRTESSSSSILDQDFEPSEEAVTRLMEMGFSRDHAWVAIESTRSNQLEIAMEYALSHPPPSPRDVERRRNAVEERRRQREQRSQTNESSVDEAGAASSADGANQDENATQEMMEVDTKNEDIDKKPCDDSVADIRDRLEGWKQDASGTACDILTALDCSVDSSEVGVPHEAFMKVGNGDGDIEALTVVLTSFLIDICQRYSELRDRVANEIFERLGSQLTEKPVEGATQFEVPTDREKSFSALCHSAALFSRALPKTRTHILKKKLIGKIINCIENIFTPSPIQVPCPAWLAPSLLLLDLMAQPIVAFSYEDSNASTDADDVVVRDELQQVELEHKKQADELSTLARDLFLALGRVKSTSDEKKSNNEESKGMEVSQTEENEGKSKASTMDGDKAPEELLFKAVPAYFPLLPLAYTHRCVDICLNILDSTYKSPGVVHGTLLLLLRILRSPGISTFCVKAGLAEKVLKLPRESRFKGHCGLVTLIYRRLLEDEPTLQASMETEIRGTITKLHGRSPVPVSDDKNPSVSRKAFVQAITPLLCREPFSFLKAVAVTVRFEHEQGGASSDGKVTLLSPADRARNLRIVSEFLKKGRSRGSSSIPRSRKSNISPRSKTPTRSNKRGLTPKRVKKDKHEHKDKSEDEGKAPAAFVTNILINYISKMSDVGQGITDGVHVVMDFGYDSNFIWAADALRILSDLVFAIPACATTIHRFRPIKSKSTTAAEMPPKTFVGFLLHSLLVQDRSSCTSELQLWEDQEGTIKDTEKNAKKLEALRRTKISQAAAKLLFALVARPGEGRRRVISELAFALSGGLLGLSGTSQSFVESLTLPHASEIPSLQAWGELCIGLAAPRSSGNNYDGENSLSFEVIRIMLDIGVAHALLVAMHRIPLSHPHASSTIAALMLPFEVLSRPTVTDAVKELVEKETASRDAKGSSKSTRLSTSDQGKDRNDSFADDHMLEDAFAIHASQEGHIEPPDMGDRYIDHDDLQQPQVDAPHEEFLIADSDPHMEEVEMHQNHMEMEEDLEEDNGSDEDMSSSEESDESSEEEDEEESDDDEEEESDDDDDDEDDDDDSESIIEDDESSAGNDVESEIDFNAEYSNEAMVDHPDMGDEDITIERGEPGMDEGWTRIESNGFGGMVLGGRRGLGQQLGNSSRARGFIDATEAMIGTLLRTGEIHGDAIAELERSLGIRIMHHTTSNNTDRGLHGSPSTGIFSRGQTNSDRARGDVLGTLPQIHQRQQPDVGYSGLGEGRRWSVSSMEYVYGGPSVSAGSRNYDLIPRVIEPSEEVVPSISHIDAPLFPGGPASVAHSLTQNALHPLLCGIDLPPINALVSDLLPHGMRETQNGQLNSRSPGDWTSSSFSGSLTGGVLVSTSNGHIIRSSRGNTGLSFAMNAQPRTLPGPVGWSDDGLPFDATVEEFSSAFERAIGDAMTLQLEHISAERNEVLDEGGHVGSGNESGDSGADTLMAEAPDGDAQPIDTSDGDGVASSLAAGLRLSPHHGTNDQTNDPARDSLMADNTSSAEVELQGHTDGNVDLNREEEVSTNIRLHHEENAPLVEESSELLVCPPDVDPDVFMALPPDMQREVVEQARAAADVASQLDAGSSLDPETLAALPEDVRREVIEQEQRERRMLEQAPADPANAQEMDNASFVASLAPDLREEILLTVDDAFLQSLPASLRTEAQILRERASVNRRMYEEPSDIGNQARATAGNVDDTVQRGSQDATSREPVDNTVSARRKQRAVGKMRVESDRDAIVYLPSDRSPGLNPPVAKVDLEAFLRILYLLSPVRPQKLIHKVFQNMTSVLRLRRALTSSLIKLLHDDNEGALAAISTLEIDYEGTNDWRSMIDSHFEKKPNDFPPPFLIGAAPEVLETDGLSPNLVMMKRKQTSDTAASIAANLPMTARGSRHERYLPPVVATRIIDTLQTICKNSPRFCVSILVDTLVDRTEIENGNPTGFDKLLDLLEKPRYTKSSANLEQLLVLIESAVSPLSNLPKHVDEDGEASQQDLDNTGVSSGKEWVDVPKIVVSQGRLQLLCSILRMETCRETSFAKVNTIARRLCRIDANRGYILAELASVARALGADAIRDLKALSIRMSNAIESTRNHATENDTGSGGSDQADVHRGPKCMGSASNSIAVSTSTSELKLLRVLQTLQALCTDVVDDNATKKDGNVYVTDELVHLLHAMELDDLWSELSSCLKIVQLLEGVKFEEDKDSTSVEGNQEGDDDNAEGGKKLQNSVAGLLTRFLPSIESFFVANASATRTIENGTRDDGGDGSEQSDDVHLVGGNRLVDFVTANKMLLNALVRNNSSLLDKGLRALVHVPRCRILLDFDVKRHWFKAQVRRLRQHANRRHGSLRLHINRKNVLIDAYHQLRLRNADEMRGRLHITFRDEQGVDAGGLSREFFGILAKEIFNPNYALFTSTEDGSTFQPNPNSSINPDHLSYFRFVGRIVGKAVLDGYLLDAHFTRSLYKHMLGIKPTHHDMEAIDPDYYKNLKTILEYDLGDLGLELTFSIDDHSFGRSRLIDLIPNGRNVAVTEENKAKYVSLVCQHRMTTAISSQINAYLDGFYELVSRDLISIFTPRELELLISGLPDIDVQDLKQNTDYVGWKASDQQIQWFWNVLFSLTRNQKAAFLQFVTGSSKVPLAGFGELPGMRGVQKFSIHKASGAAGALMSAHTCFNSLDLPVYNSEDELREKLLYAITEGGGTFLLA